MKKIIVSLAALVSIVANAQVKVKGSDTVLPIGQKEAEESTQAHTSRSSFVGSLKIWRTFAPRKVQIFSYALV